MEEEGRAEVEGGGAEVGGGGAEVEGGRAEVEGGKAEVEGGGAKPVTIQQEFMVDTSNITYLHNRLVLPNGLR